MVSRPQSKSSKVTLEEVFYSVRSPKGSITTKGKEKEKLSAVGFHQPASSLEDLKQVKPQILADRSLTAATTARSTERQVIV